MSYVALLAIKDYLNKMGVDYILYIGVPDPCLEVMHADTHCFIWLIGDTVTVTGATPGLLFGHESYHRLYLSDPNCLQQVYEIVNRRAHL